MQRLINICKYEYCKTDTLCLDYASKDNTIGNDAKRALIGERSLLYNCFYNILNEEFSEMDKQYFYQYLIIKNTFRNELVQTNGKIGFKNFNNYQSRKEVFIKGFKQYESELVRLAINATLGEENILSLEARICPKKESSKNREEINHYDKIVNEKQNPKHFYVYHFPKCIDDEYASPHLSRHFKNRKKVFECSRAIITMIEKDNSLRQRVRGIDACANEIGCRPEVFAHSFRYLMNTQIRKDLLLSGTPYNNPEKLNATYHVGEDFLDIIDGLRAIDEVIVFFNFKKGNRLGHAIALGINADSYYKKKKMKLIMTKQDAIDNIAWLLEKSKEFNINVNSEVSAVLYERFNSLMKEVYCNENISTNIYYNSWKLRGDDPEMYFNDNKENCGKSIIESENYKLNNNVSDQIRSNLNCRDLYFRYHFDVNVKKEGYKKHVFEVDENYIHLVKRIQNEMLEHVKSIGIMIESNPSSNYLIGTIERYEHHPIFKFFDINSTKESNMSVSINTDDQGVFETSLQNEYALLSLSLKKGKGVNHHDNEKILNYLDNIRCSGLEQVFK